SGVGVGTFQRLAFVSILRLKFVDGMGIGNLIVIPGTLFLFVVAAIAGLLIWPYVIALWLGTFIGARHATKFVHRIPDTYLRTLLVVIVMLYLSYLILSLS